MVGYKISLSIERSEINVPHYAATNDDTQTCSPLSPQKFNSPEQTGGVWGKHLYQLMYLHPGGANKTISFSLVSLIPTSITVTWLLQSLQCITWYTCDLPGIINNNNNMMLDESWESEQQQLWWQMMMMTTGLIMNEMMNLKLWVIILGTLFIVWSLDYSFARQGISS